MRKEHFAIGRYGSWSQAAQFAREEAMRRSCCCAARPDGHGSFLVIAYERPPVRALLDLAVAAEFVSPKTDLSEFRKQCLCAGLTGAGWTFVSRHGRAAFTAALHPIIRRPSQLAGSLHLIQWQAEAQLKAPLPVELAERYVSVMGVILNQAPFLDPRLARAAADHWAVSSNQTRADFVDNQWVPVLVWMRDKNPRLEKSQWRSGWPAIWRSFLRWSRDLPHAAEWSSSLSQAEINGWHIRALESAADLAHEAVKMKNCVASYADKCLAGNYRVFSIADKVNKPVATLGIKRARGRWEIDQVKGKCNRAPSQQVKEAARQFLARYERADSLWHSVRDAQRQDVTAPRRCLQHTFSGLELFRLTSGAAAH